MHEHGTVTVYWDLPGTSLLNHKGKYLKEEKRKINLFKYKKKKVFETKIICTALIERFNKRNKKINTVHN